MNTLPALAATLLLGLAGCGSGDADADATSAATVEDTATVAAETPPTPTAPEESSGGTGGLSAEDAAAIEQVLVTWDIEGGCEYMTDKFLEELTFIEDRDEACAVHESSEVEKQYTADDIVISGIKETAAGARAVLGSDITPDVTVTFFLVEADGAWLINGYDF